jgi:hypothetical protein
MIDVELAAFLQEGIAIQLGTRNERLEPNGVRVVAVAVEAGGRHLVAYVPEAAVSHVLPDLESNGQAALVFAAIRLRVTAIFNQTPGPNAGAPLVTPGPPA